MVLMKIFDADVAVVFVLCIAASATITRAAPRPVNISNTWVLPESSFPVFYRYFRDRISWYEADAVCQFHHGNLVTVDSSSQFDAVRSYLKELNIVSNVWIGLTKANENTEFVWSNSKTLSGDGFWGEAAPTVSTPLCAATDPSKDFRWHALGCGGPEVASFICELPVPLWATGSEGCILPSLPLTVIYLPEQTALELTSDCGLEGTRRIACKGKADQSEMIRQLSCPQEKSSIASSSSTPYSTHTVKSEATKPWIWTSNTIDTGDFGSPTRHRRETEDMLSTADGITITKETSTLIPQEITKTSKNTITKKLEMKVTEPATTIKPYVKSVVKLEVKTTTNVVTIVPKPIVTTMSSSSPQTPVVTQTTKVTEMLTVKNKIKDSSQTAVTEEALTVSPQSVTDLEPAEYPSINQGQLFSLIENGTVFDIIEVNDTASDFAEKNKDKTKIIDETTTKVTLSSNINLKKEITTARTTKPSTENPVFTTVSYIKEAPFLKTSEAPITTIVKQPTIETNQQEIIVKNISSSSKDLTNGEQDKTFIKAIESSAGSSLVKLNRTSRKELPLIDFNFTSEEIKSEDDKNISKSIEHEHKVVEITLMHDDKKKEGAKLYVTTKKHDKLKIRKNDKAKIIDIDKNKNKNTYLMNENPKAIAKLADEDITPSEVHAMLPENIPNTTTVKVIDPKLIDLNFNTTKNKHSEHVPIKIQEAPTTEFIKEDTEYDLEDDTKYEPKTTDDGEIDINGKTTEEPLEPIPEAQPRPNRNRVLTRPQRRSFYPYFFSRVLG